MEPHCGILWGKVWSQWCWGGCGHTEREKKITADVYWSLWKTPLTTMLNRPHLYRLTLLPEKGVCSKSSLFLSQLTPLKSLTRPVWDSSWGLEAHNHVCKFAMCVHREHRHSPPCHKKSITRREGLVLKVLLKRLLCSSVTADMFFLGSHLSLWALLEYYSQALQM